MFCQSFEQTSSSHIIYCSYNGYNLEEEKCNREKTDRPLAVSECAGSYTGDGTCFWSSRIQAQLLSLFLSQGFCASVYQDTPS
jgi:hypothetical protein